MHLMILNHKVLSKVLRKKLILVQNETAVQCTVPGTNTRS